VEIESDLMRGLALVALMVHVAAAQCSLHQSCPECNSFVGPSGSACKWCVRPGGVPLSAGCVEATGACPSSASVADVCPPSLCETALTCSECVAKASPSGGPCGWCVTPNSLNIGCRSSSLTCGETINVFMSQCSVATVNVAWQMVFFPLSVALGLVVGLIVVVRTSKSDVGTLVRACTGLFVLSFVLYGAALFSFLLSVRVVNKMRRDSCNCFCSWIWIFGLLELATITGGVLAGTIFDS
jgi:hypothetical protein